MQFVSDHYHYKMKLIILLLIGLISIAQSNIISKKDLGRDDFLEGTFPDGFRWGFATASYQIEGGWNADGKGLNIWDEFTHRVPSPIYDNSTGDIACDSYHKYKEDVQLLKDMGAHYYRFSLSWSRILPDGTINNINEAGIQYYNNLIDELLANGIDPMITLYHWDLPQPLQEIGGWPNEALIEHFTNFARLAYERFGDRVKYWITFNEAYVVCQLGYGYGVHAPGINEESTEPYKCAHTILKSHANAYRLYESEFKPTQGGRCGITIDSGWYEPLNPEDPADVEAAERNVMFKHGWYAYPIYFGRYPDIMRSLIDAKSIEEGRNESRLPSFDAEWSNKLRGSTDFLGLNHYTTELSKSTNGGPPGWSNDKNTAESQSDEWIPSAASWLKMVPWGMRRLLVWIKETYGNPEVMITENGFSDVPEVEFYDMGRAQYYKSYINEMLKAIDIDGCNITHYTAWSLLDNFEWARGYSERFGVHQVDMSDPERPRKPKYSASVLKKIFQDNGFP